MGKIVRNYMLLLIVSILFGASLMLFTYSLPLDKVYEHIEESRSIYESDRTNWFGNSQFAVLDLYTEQLMLNISIFRPYESLIDNSVLNAYFVSQNDSDNSFLKILDETDISKSGAVVSYERYWHGYLVFLIPALELINVGEIKSVLLIVQLIMFSLVVYGLSKYDLRYVFAFAASAIIINPAMTSLCFQYADIYMISMFFMICVLYGDGWLSQGNRYIYFWAIEGVVVAFVDFFTYPLVALGIPLLTLMIIRNNGFKDNCKKVIQYSLSWGIAYIVMWFGKFFEVELFTDVPMIEKGISQIVYRTVGDATESGIENDSYAATLRAMGRIIKEPPMLLNLLLMIVGIIFISIIIRKKRKESKSLIQKSVMKELALKELLPVCFISMWPFVYFLVVKNHSVVHPWIEYRELAITVYGVGIILIKAISMKIGNNILQNDDILDNSVSEKN